MHNIKRTKEPESLNNNKVRWTNDLLEEIDRVGSFTNVSDSIKRKYRQDDVIDSLQKMNGGESSYCYYCEIKIGKEGYGHVEHFKPKSKFPRLFCEWDNLLWTCKRCNTKKGQKWDDNNPIINPCDDNMDVTEQFIYFTHQLIGKTEIGKNTVRELHLNNPKENSGLINARRDVFIEIMELIQVINGLDGQNRIIEIEKLNQQRFKFEFKAMIKYTLETMLNTNINLDN